MKFLFTVCLQFKGCLFTPWGYSEHVITEQKIRGFKEVDK